MGLFGKASATGDKARDKAWVEVCHLEDALVGRKPGHAPDVPALPFPVVVVAIDGRGGTEEALQWGARLQRGGATLWVVTAGGAGGDRSTEIFMTQAADPAALLEKAKAQLAALGATASVALLQGAAAFAIARFAQQQGAGLVVLGSPARGLTVAGGPQGVSQNLKAMTRASLLVARKPPASQVWCATDGSRPARQALAAAHWLARTLAVPLAILHAKEPTRGPEPTPVAPAPVAEASARILIGRPAASLLEACALQQDAVLVMGMRGRTGGGLYSFGTVSDEVLARSPSSVLVVQSEAPPAFL